MTNTYIIVAFASYLLGSVPFGYILVKLFLKTDVRSQGSGNIGATNVARTGKKGLAIATLFLDALKGYVAVMCALAYAAWRTRDIMVKAAPGFDRAELYFAAGAIAALFAILGHMFPVWLRFKGGKGVATGMGVFLALAPKAVGLVLIVFIILFALTRYVSLGSIVASALFPVAFYYLHPKYSTAATMVLISGVSALIIWKHRENIARLIAGTESKLGAKKQ